MKYFFKTRLGNLATHWRTARYCSKTYPIRRTGEQLYDAKALLELVAGADGKRLVRRTPEAIAALDAGDDDVSCVYSADDRQISPGWQSNTLSPLIESVKTVYPYTAYGAVFVQAHGIQLAFDGGIPIEQQQ